MGSSFLKDESLSGQAQETKEPATYHRLALEIAADQAEASPIRLKIISDSMAPMLQPGDTVIMFPMTAGISPQRGDMIVFQSKNGVDAGLPLTHRLIRRTASGWIAKGDHRLFPDAPIIEAICSEK